MGRLHRWRQGRRVRLKADEFDGARWFSSKASSGGRVEAAYVLSGRVGVRDSGNPGVILAFGADAWGAFLGGVKGGEFD